MGLGERDQVPGTYASDENRLGGGRKRVFFVSMGGKNANL